VIFNAYEADDPPDIVTPLLIVTTAVMGLVGLPRAVYKLRLDELAVIA
jgi:hypothetical protein